MNKITKTVLTFGSSIFLISSVFSQNAFGDTTASDLIFQRLSGVNRYETSIAISNQGWKSSDVVILASGNDFADALCAAPLAKLNNAPILLTAGTGLEDGVKSEIQRLGAKKVYIIGGKGVISSDEESMLNSITSVERIAGIDRYETSVRVAEKLGEVSQISVATGGDFADALSIASIAAQEGMPILLTEKNTIPDSVQQYIKTQSIVKSYIIGGTGVLASSLETALPDAERLSGANRFETNIKVLDKFNTELNFQNVFVAVGQGSNGTEFADALSGAPLAAQYAAPLVLTEDTLPIASQNFINKKVLTKSNIFLLGGTAVVPESIKDQLNFASSVKPVISDSTKAQLEAVQSKLPTITSSLSSAPEKALITQVQSTISKTLLDSSYDYAKDKPAATTLYNSLSDMEKAEVFNSLYQNLDLDTLTTLKSLLGL